MPTLVRGATGSAVRELQTKLLAAGFDPGGVDGAFGAKTERALRDFQAARQLTADGKAGVATLAAFGQSGFDLPQVTPLSASAPKAAAVAQDTSKLGPYRVRHSVVQIPTGNGRTMTADVYTPIGAASSPPVVHAYGLLQSAAATAGTANHYASWGLTTIVPTLPAGSGAPASNAVALKGAVDWVMSKPGTLGRSLDTSRGVALSGHSFGGLTALLTAADQRNVGAVVALDPADLMGQGLAKGSRIHAPTAFVVGRAELWNQFGNGYRIYDRVPGSQNEFLSVAGAGHMDFQNGSLAGPMNRANAVAMRYATAFLLRHLAGKAEYAPFTQDGAEVRRAKARGELR